jgi:MarR family transcriptional regulator, organic hydroperoxide resistance regulator
VARIDYRELMDMLFALHGILHGQVFRAAHSGEELGRPDFGLLALLSRAGSASPSEAAERLHMSRPQMSVVVDRLVERGLAVRGHDEDDRRVSRVSATKAGTQALEEAVSATQARIEELLAPLGARELEAVAASLRQLVSALRKAEKGKES